MPSPALVGRWLLAGLLLLVATGGFVIARSSGSTAKVAVRPERHPQTTWAACNRNSRNGRVSTFRPLSDGAAARLVTHQREDRAYNAKPYTVDGVRHPAPNFYVPSSTQIRAFRLAKSNSGQSNTQFNPYYAHVDGRDGLHRPSTDDLIQWAAHKWGIPEDWLRAEYVHETYWNQYFLGDSTPVSAKWYDQYPPPDRVAHTHNVFQSLGITQVRWAPDGSLHPGTEPLRWLSTAFNVDYQAATVRFYYDNPQGTRSSWGDASYVPCQAWNSIGAWYRPYPWNNSDQHSYVQAVQGILGDRGWQSSSFVSWSPSSFPAGLRFR